MKKSMAFFLAVFFLFSTNPFVSMAHAFSGQGESGGSALSPLVSGALGGAGLFLNLFPPALAPVPGLPGPFGGPILLIAPCFNMSAYRIIIGPPTPRYLIYQTGGSVSFLHGPPYRVGQWLLGMSGGMGVCDMSPRDGLQAFRGGLILFHGSSI